MTFFANAGIKWPNIEDQTRDAGQAALDGASNVWRLFSILEGAKELTPSSGAALENLRGKCVVALRHASKLYADIAKTIDYRYVEPLSSAELDVAALGPSYDDWRVGRVSRSRELDYEEQHSKRSYRVLADWLSAMADQIEALSFAGKQIGLMSPQVFRIMHQWEMAANLARAIAVINRRPDSRD